MQVHKAALPPCYISKNEEPANGIAGSFMLDRELSEALDNLRCSAPPDTH